MIVKQAFLLDVYLVVPQEPVRLQEPRMPTDTFKFKSMV